MSEGMKCPACGHTVSTVKDSRGIEEGVRRRRECLYCHERWTTYEVPLDGGSVREFRRWAKILGRHMDEISGAIEQLHRVMNAVGATADVHWREPEQGPESDEDQAA